MDKHHGVEYSGELARLQIPRRRTFSLNEEKGLICHVYENPPGSEHASFYTIAAGGFNALIPVKDSSSLPRLDNFAMRMYPLAGGYAT